MEEVGGRGRGEGGCQLSSAGSAIQNTVYALSIAFLLRHTQTHTFRLGAIKNIKQPPSLVPFYGTLPAVALASRASRMASIQPSMPGASG